MQYSNDNMPAIVFSMQHGYEEREKRKIQKARIESDMSQEQLAERVGVTRQKIVLIKSGNYNPSLRLCTEICEALKKTLIDLIG